MPSLEGCRVRRGAFLLALRSDRMRRGCDTVEKEVEGGTPLRYERRDHSILPLVLFSS